MTERTRELGAARDRQDAAYPEACRNDRCGRPIADAEVAGHLYLVVIDGHASPYCDAVCALIGAVVDEWTTWGGLVAPDDGSTPTRLSILRSAFGRLLARLPPTIR